ncbi:MAG: 5-(carboxyamino)imidazole ribonucleotide synthase [Gemmatimonadota bacterium]|nr:5-(carboxyamino)imidazole ribonucleotide synthase [Gemmatimonadota bacterium]
MKIGILGGGQLARMLALEGIPLGHRFTVLEGAPDPPAGVASAVVAAAYDDPDGLAAVAAAADVVTYEFENVPADSAAYLAARVPALPPPGALQVSQDRLAEKRMFRELGISTAPFHPVDGPEDVEEAVAVTGLPAVIKTRRLGYDGKGQAVVRSLGEAEAAVEELGAGLIVEGFVAFERELSVLAVAGREGGRAFYPLTENHHRGGILRVSYAPAPGLAPLRAPAPALTPAPDLPRTSDLTPSLQSEAERLAALVLDRLDYIGVLAIELFEVGGRLLANEMAPRVHNSGHWTLDGADVSQFENHIRAVTVMPLATPRVPGPAAMVNVIGELPDPGAVASIPGAHLHLYGKAPRPGRKIGHVNVTARDEAAVMRAVSRVWELLPGAGELPMATGG